MFVDKDYMVRIRRELHQVPEIGFDLPKSLAIIRRELASIGLPYREDVGRSCIIATLNEGVENQTIALRADFDGLPIEEKTGLPFASLHPGQMHACGHDCHAAMLLGTAKALKAMEKDLTCCIKFVFQAAEETLSGAKTICDCGFMDGVDKILACHIEPDYPVGTVLLNRNCDSACSRGFKLHLYGKAAHVARPHQGVDAIAMAARVYDGIQVMKQTLSEPVIIGVGAIHGGETNNIICDHVMMNVSLRTQETSLDKRIYDRITQIAEDIAAEMGGKAMLETYKYTPALRNDLVVADEVETAAKKAGISEILPKPDSMTAEDFAFYLQHKPGAIFWIGAKPENGETVSLHNEKLVINEDALDVAPKIFTQYILDQMER